MRANQLYDPLLLNLFDRVFNLFDRKASDIDYFYPSRLPDEPKEGVDDIIPSGRTSEAQGQCHRLFLT